VIRGIGAGCDDEAIRVIQAAPPWKPGKQRGKAVRSSFNLAIIFKLN
jgi:protein TonB